MSKSPLSATGSGCIGSMLGGILGIVIAFSIGMANLKGNSPTSGFLPLDAINGLLHLFLGLIIMIPLVAIGALLGSVMGSTMGVSVGRAAEKEFEKPVPPADSSEEIEQLRARLAQLEAARVREEAAKQPDVGPVEQPNAVIDDVPANIADIPPEPLPVLWIGTCPACGCRVDMTEKRQMSKPHICPQCREVVVMD